MFGANDSTQISNDDPAMLDNVKQLAQEPADQVAPQQSQFMTASTPTSSQFAATPAPTSPQPGQPVAQQTAVDEPVAADSVPAPQPATAEPALGFSSSPMPDSPTGAAPETSSVSAQATDDSAAPDQTSDNTPIAAASVAPSAPVNTDQLAGMKQQALDHLEPLVEHLDQSPEESFKTTMMMIQANDNHTLLEKALEEAKLIEDDKIRANAMLDIINEINYFSQTSQ